jgi:hypothetical protein
MKSGLTQYCALNFHWLDGDKIISLLYLSFLTFIALVITSFVRLFLFQTLFFIIKLQLTYVNILFILMMMIQVCGQRDDPYIGHISLMIAVHFFVPWKHVKNFYLLDYEVVKDQQF